MRKKQVKKLLNIKLEFKLNIRNDKKYEIETIFDRKVYAKDALE